MKATGKVEKVTIEAVVRRADGSVEDLGTICEMKSKGNKFINTLKKIKGGN